MAHLYDEEIATRGDFSCWCWNWCFFFVGIDSVSLLYTWRWIDHCSLCHNLVQRSIPAINKVSSLVIISYISYCFQFTISSIGYTSKASISQIKRTHLLQTCNQSIIELSDYRTLLNYINRWNVCKVNLNIQHVMIIFTTWDNTTFRFFYLVIRLVIYRRQSNNSIMLAINAIQKYVVIHPFTIYW